MDLLGQWWIWTRRPRGAAIVLWHYLSGTLKVIGMHLSGSHSSEGRDPYGFFVTAQFYLVLFTLFTFEWICEQLAVISEPRLAVFVLYISIAREGKTDVCNVNCSPCPIVARMVLRYPPQIVSRRIESWSNGYPAGYPNLSDISGNRRGLVRNRPPKKSKWVARSDDEILMASGWAAIYSTTPSGRKKVFWTKRLILSSSKTGENHNYGNNLQVEISYALRRILLFPTGYFVYLDLRSIHYIHTKCTSFADLRKLDPHYRERKVSRPAVPQYGCRIEDHCEGSLSNLQSSFRKEPPIFVRIVHWIIGLFFVVNFSFFCWDVAALGFIEGR